MDTPNIFLTLVPANVWGLAADSFRLPHNIARYIQPSPISRETTPSDSVHDETPVNELDYFHRIQLRFHEETKVKGRITFGSDPDRCDVLLNSRRPQFYISFDSDQRPAIWDDSNNGLTVCYDGQAKDERRNHFKWIFFPEYRTITVTIPLRKKRELAFDVLLPQHYWTYPKEYKDNVDRFMDSAPLSHEVALDNLDLGSQGTSFAPSESLSPTKRPVPACSEKTLWLERKPSRSTDGHYFYFDFTLSSDKWNRAILDLIKGGSVFPDTTILSYWLAMR